METNSTNEQSGNYDASDPNRCAWCHVRMVDRSYNPNSCLCDDCRQELTKLRIPNTIKIISLIFTALVVATLVLSYPDMKNYGSFKNSEAKADDGYVVSSMDNLVDLLGKYPDSKYIAIELADLGMEYEYYDYAAYAIDNYLIGIDLSDSEDNKLSDYIDEINIYYDTTDIADSLSDDAGLNDATTSDEYISAMDTYSESLSNLLGNESYNQQLIYYYLAYFANNDDDRKYYLETCTLLTKNNFDANAQLANYYRRYGDLDKADDIITDSYNRNKEDPSTLRSIGIIKMLQGNLSEGLDFAKKAYDTYPEGDYVTDTYIVALAANSQLDKAKALKDQSEEDGYYFDAEMDQYLNGELSLAQYYVDEEDE